MRKRPFGMALQCFLSSSETWLNKVPPRNAMEVLPQLSPIHFMVQPPAAGGVEVRKT